MKKQFKIIFMGVIFLTACGKSNHSEHQSAGDSKENPNQALYEQVIAIHDEVMPKSDQIYKAKADLKEKLGSTNVTDLRKKEIEQAIAGLDSADHSMMDWMHKFKPLADSTNEEAAREYLENEMEKIKNVRELINLSLQRAKEEQDKK